MQDVPVVKARKAGAVAPAVIVERPVKHQRGVWQRAVALTVRVLEAARVHAGHGVKVLYQLGHGIAAAAKALDHRAHDHARGIAHDQHKAGIALAGDFIKDNAVVILVHEAEVAERPVAGGVGGALAGGFDVDERRIGRDIDVLDLGVFNGGDLRIGQKEVGEETDGAGLAHRGDKHIPRRRRRALFEHKDSGEQRQQHQHDRYQKNGKDAQRDFSR